jgi:phosphatidate cytidylyltransferase
MQTVVWIYATAFGAGAIAVHLANRNVDRAERRRRWTKFAAYFVIVSAVLCAASAGPLVFVALLAIVALIGAHELRGILRSSARAPFAAGIWAAYALACTGLLCFGWWSTPHEAVFTYLTVAFFDGFSQISGQLVGRHPLVRRLSPGKTWEGMIGGWMTAVACGVALRRFVGLDVTRAAAITCAIAFAALFGDLAASWVKRKCGVKDFGTWLPAHGGVLDRFDGFLFALPAVYYLLQVMQPWVTK